MRQASLFLAVLCAGLCAPAVGARAADSGPPRKVGSGRAPRKHAVRLDRPHATTCTTEYAPSAWEREWAAGAAAIGASDTICEHMATAAAAQKSDAWLRYVSGCWNGNACAAGADPGVMSSFVTTCSAGGAAAATAVHHIEPLVGLLRHPFAKPACVPAGRAGTSVQDRGYLVLLGSDPAFVKARYPGRRYMFDAGTAAFNSSLAWLTAAYARKGIHFDENFAWEVKDEVADGYWKTVPRHDAKRIHFSLELVEKLSACNHHGGQTKHQTSHCA